MEQRFAWWQRCALDVFVVCALNDDRSAHLYMRASYIHMVNARTTPTTLSLSTAERLVARVNDSDKLPSTRTREHLYAV